MHDPKALLLDCVKIFEARGETHGRFDASLGLIAELWSIYLANTLGKEITLDARDACHMLALMKIARSILNPSNLDNYQDAAVYEILAAALSDAPRSGDRGSTS